MHRIPNIKAKHKYIKVSYDLLEIQVQAQLTSCVFR